MKIEIKQVLKIHIAIKLELNFIHHFSCCRFCSKSLLDCSIFYADKAGFLENLPSTFQTSETSPFEEQHVHQTQVKLYLFLGLTVSSLITSIIIETPFQRFNKICNTINTIIVLHFSLKILIFRDQNIQSYLLSENISHHRLCVSK